MSLPAVQQVGPPARRAEEALGALIDAKELELSTLQRGYLRARWLAQVAQLEQEVQRARRRHHALRVVTLIGCLLILMLVSLTGDARLSSGWHAVAQASTIILSLLVSASVALEFIFNFGERWHRLEHQLGRLKAEGWRFLQLSGHYRHYDNHASAFTAFAHQVEELSQREVEVYNSAVIHERRKGALASEGEFAKKLVPSPESEQLAAATAAPPLHASPRPVTRAASQTRS